MRNGISLLDIMVALAVGSILSIMLYRSFTQTNQVVRVIEAISGMSMDLTLASDRLEKDLSGAFVPVQGIPKPKPKEDEKQKRTISVGATQKEETPRLGDVFVVSDQRKRTSQAATLLLTFITSNPLVVYGETPARIVRVVYMLRPHKAVPGLLELVRYESPELELKQFEARQAKGTIQGHQLISTLKTITVTCTVRKQEPEEEKEKKEKASREKKEKQEKEKPIEWEHFTRWRDEERIKENKVIMPEVVEIKGTAVDARGKREMPFHFLIPIAATPPSEAPQTDQSKPQDETAKRQKWGVTLELPGRRRDDHDTGGKK